MAKNKNRDRNKQQAPTSDRSSEQDKSSSMEDRSEQVQQRITPSDVAHKGREKRFGHN